jgi:hypothetical protein
MDDAEREAHTRRLIHLKVRRAIQGINTPPEILIEIEDIEGILGNISPISDNDNVISGMSRLGVVNLIDDKRKERDILVRRLNEIYRIKEGNPMQYFMRQPDIRIELVYLQRQVLELNSMIDRLITFI